MRSNLIIVFFSFLSFIFTSSSIHAQEEAISTYNFEHYTDENGLPQNSVKAIMKDKNGFVWLSTEAGLVRFDGHRFLTFTKSLIPISSNRFTGFFPSISKYENGNLYEFYALAEGGEYIGILENGLVDVDTFSFGKNLKLGRLQLSKLKINVILPSLPTLYPNDPFSQPYIAFSEKKRYYIWEKNKISFYQDEKEVYQVEGLFRHFFLIGKSPYVVTTGGNFAKIQSRNETREVGLGGDITGNPDFKAWKNRVRLFWNNGSLQTFLYLNKCFYKLEESKKGGLTTTLILKDFDFVDNAIASAFYDNRSGSLFLGSITKGLFVIKKKAFQTLKSQEKGADNVFYSQIPLANNSILTAQGYNLGLNSKSAAFVARNKSALMNAIKYKFSLAMNRDSTFWMGVGYNLYKFEKTGKSVLKHLVLKEKFKSLYVGQDDVLWIGGISGGLFHMNPADSIPQLVIRGFRDEILVMHRETEQSFLFATRKGLYRLDGRSKVLVEITNFKNITIRSFYTTADGIWITTYGNGIYLMGNKRIVHFPIDRHQFLATAHCIVEDSRGYFWITTNKGLFQVAKKQLLDYTANNHHPVYYLYYDKSHGFESNEFNGGCSPCAVQLPNGIVSLPSMDGLVWFSPNKIQPVLPDHRIFVSKIEVDGAQIPAKDTVEISRDFDQLRLHVATPYFGHVNNIQMSYSLTTGGKAAKWLPVEDFIIPLSKISSGKYDLVIRKVNGFGENDYTYKRIKLNIPPAWYETWWFWCLVVLFSQAALLGIVRWRTRYLLDKEREANLRRHYRVISQIVAAVNHDIQTPLHYVTYSLQQINSHLHKQLKGNPLITQMSDESLNTTLRIATLTKNLLDYIKLQNKNALTRTAMGSINAFELVSDACKVFSAIAKTKNIDIINEVDPGIEVNSDPNLLSIVIHNFLDNALKITKSNVHISSSSLNNRKRIMITDDGDGMPESLLYWLNKSYKSYEEWLRISAYPEQKGIGLVIVKDLCVLLNIELIVTVTAGRGTVIELAFN